MTTPLDEGPLLTPLTDPDNALFFVVPDDAPPKVPFGPQLTTSLTAAADVHDGAMLALVPSRADAERLALAGFEPVDQLHCTLTFLGPAVAIPTDVQTELVLRARTFFTTQPAVEAEVLGFNVWNPLGERCVVGSLTGSDLEDFHDSVLEFWEETGFPVPEQHEPWIPHITVAYVPQDEDVLLVLDDALGRVGPIVLDTLRLAFGGVSHDIPLWDASGLTAGDVHVFHLPGQHNQKAHGHLTTVSVAEQQNFQKKLKKAKTGEKAHRAAASTDAFGAKGPDGYGEHGPDTVEGFPGTVGEYQVYGEVINGSLRDGRAADWYTDDEGFVHGHQRTVESLDGAFARKKSELRDDIVVERGISHPDRTFGDSWSSTRSNAGLTWDDAGYVSTTTDHGVLSHFASHADASSAPVAMRVFVPRGTHALRVGKNGSNHRYEHESEVVLPRGQRYRIMADHGVDADGVHNVDVELLGPASDLIAAATPSPLITEPTNADVELLDANLPTLPPFIDEGPPVLMLRSAMMEMPSGDYVGGDTQGSDDTTASGYNVDQTHASGEMPWTPSR